MQALKEFLGSVLILVFWVLFLVFSLKKVIDRFYSLFDYTNDDDEITVKLVKFIVIAPLWLVLIAISFRVVKHLIMVSVDCY